MQPNMTPQYEAELKKLHAQIGSEQKRTARHVETLRRRRKANDRRRDAAMRKLRRETAKAEKAILKEHRLSDRPLISEINASFRAHDRREAALQKRIAILTGRLSS